jgi:uncharacterized protein YaaW (UPF0174 family)
LEPIIAAKLAFDGMKFTLTTMAKAVQSLYGVATNFDDFLDKHIASMKASPDASIAGTGRVLEGAKQGLFLGYAAPVVLIATGQLLLGNPLSALGTVATAATLQNPIAITCAAVGAIWFGWKALSEAEQKALVEKLSQGFSLAVDVIRQTIDLALNLLRSTFRSKEIAALKVFLADSAALVGRSMYAITGRLKDLIYSPLPAVEIDTDGLTLGNPLMPVLKAMDRESELEPLLITALKVDRKIVKNMAREEQERHAARELSEAAGYSLPGTRSPAYDDIVRIVARKMKLPTRAELRTEDLERAILFTVIERSMERMSDEEKTTLTREVGQSLRERGIDRNVSYAEVFRLVKFTGVDVGGTVGAMAMTAPGVAGAVGLNALQFIVLKGIVMTSGYVAAGGAVLGFGMGAAMLSVAGAAGPIGVALALLYTAYSLSGPAFRKLIPAICMISAKRLEIETGD